ncbi:nucleotidyltransferase domain-containing protein [Nonomuraea soli]|uniref:Nucleotidyltransferase domain-containing protein n=1 Tax=Nonomuraea soli TaxID=1032476 RepID=A0A7W0HTK2_9ACTN|nr:nucleotidyltransferase domain-containing protein [Nonomuraea soli]MBA2895120.1 hypothetical protein [Nonomuraea soli]
MLERISRMAGELAEVPGVVGVVLGGSRARDEHHPGSDWDLGVYYRGRLDEAALERLAGAPVAGPGGWGPWVDGGAWLRVDGVAVDWILRDLDRVERVWESCRAGRYEIGVQPGHPLGFYSSCYAGELALARVLADPGGRLAALRGEMALYPEALREALVAGAWEAGFLVDGAAKSAARGDVLHVSLCLARAVGVLVQALYAAERRWCLNEKGALAVASAFPSAPEGFGERARALLGAPGQDAASLTETVEAARVLVEETRARLP